MSDAVLDIGIVQPMFGRAAYSCKPNSGVQLIVFS